ncbi:hypothetical protein GTQ41_05530 [Pseudomonas sp. AN-B15]|nr:hypothetical protein [Pseudomonas sp. AN-B15]QXE08530.1 hypothetical protein GTQ41_05530 [Pseudomonas sp. AN-B15]
MPTEKMKAYHVGEGSEGEHVITFATNSATARREGGNELNLTFEEVEFCRRAPWADQFAGQPFIPAKAYHEQGWWFYCNNCENQLYEDEEDDEGNPLAIVYDGRHAYCDQNCKDARDKKISDANAKGEAFKAKVLAERPDLTFTEWSIGWPRISMSAKFQFPGSQYGGSVSDHDGDGTLTWYVAQGDKAAWDLYQQERAA